MARLKRTAKQVKAAANQAAEEAQSSAAANKTNSFSRTIAKEHAEKAAVPLQYLAHHVSQSKHVHGGKKWFFKTLDGLAETYPW